MTKQLTLDINTCTLQEAMDYSMKKLVEQGIQCRDVIGNCVYGDDKENHCAVGWLLDHDNETLMSFVGSVYELDHEYNSILPKIISENLDAFNRLQSIHDAVGSAVRRAHTRLQKQHNIDTSGDHWQQWIDLAEIQI